MKSFEIFLYLLLTILFVNHIPNVCADTWITIWNKLDVPAKIRCWREGATKNRSFKRKIVDADDRYDIKGIYPKKKHAKYYRHWCEVYANDKTIKFDVFGGKDKRINKISDSYSDWIIDSAGIYRFRKGQLILYYGKNWLDEERSITDDLAGTPEKEINPNDFVYIAPLEVNIATAKMSMTEQRYAITKATYASHKFENATDMANYVRNSMKKKFGYFWEAFVEKKASNKSVKRTCDLKSILNFSVNELNFIICRVMR